MPELDFRILGVESVERGLVPLLHFLVEVCNRRAAETVQTVMLQAQIQIQAPERSYSAAEKEKLRDIFGPPEEWGRTLGPKLLAHSHTVVRGFTDRTEAVLPVPFTFDLNVASAKYFEALEDGEAPLLFLFSGAVFYFTSEGRLQVGQISWNAECGYRMPVVLWREMMERHYPGGGWIRLDRGTRDRLSEFRRLSGCATWEQAVARLLEATAGTP